MTDISMCLNEKCEKREVCYRFTAIPSTRQSYVAYDKDQTGRCDSFMPVYDNNKQFVD